MLYPVYHNVGKKKNRKGALEICFGTAFHRSERGPVPLNEIPATCETCGQELQMCHLDFSVVVDLTPRVPLVNKPRHHGPRGCPVIEE